MKVHTLTKQNSAFASHIRKEPTARTENHLPLKEKHPRSGPHPSSVRLMWMTTQKGQLHHSQHIYRQIKCTNKYTYCMQTLEGSQTLILHLLLSHTLNSSVIFALPQDISMQMTLLSWSLIKVASRADGYINHTSLLCFPPSYRIFYCYIPSDIRQITFYWLATKASGWSWTEQWSLRIKRTQIDWDALILVWKELGAKRHHVQICITKEGACREAALNDRVQHMQRPSG